MECWFMFFAVLVVGAVAAVIIAAVMMGDDLMREDDGAWLMACEKSIRKRIEEDEAKLDKSSRSGQQ